MYREETRPPVPPFDDETARLKVRAAEDAWNLRDPDRVPYFGVRLVPVGVGINSHGLKTDTNASVVSVRGAPIPGLYAVGNAAALLDIGGGYQSGTSNMRAITWGYIAGRHLMGAS